MDVAQIEKKRREEGEKSRRQIQLTAVSALKRNKIMLTEGIIEDHTAKKN